ncbi:unnamed protein product [Durusdinium trenchii]|uniref:Tetrapyrrole methylase domain-containing protein n=1 Tax=Durusdinium trenchii TaxID=1381693 RepID=A0ABP0LW68_9DINO
MLRTVSCIRLSRTRALLQRPCRCLSTGTLFAVATPIGNLQDASARVISTLQRVEVVAAESSEVLEALKNSNDEVMNPFQKVQSFYAHNEEERMPELLAHLREGHDVAITTRAGTVGICDVGARLIKAAHAEGISVSSIPGPCSITAALAASGFSGSQFFFDGYLPAMRKARLELLRSRLGWLKDGGLDEFILVNFCNGDMLEEVLVDFDQVLGAEAQICVAKDISMPYENVLRGAIGAVRRTWATLEAQRGAVVLLAELRSKRRGTASSASSSSASSGSKELKELAQVFQKHHVPVQKASLIAAQLTGRPVEEALEAMKAALGEGSINKADAQEGGARLTLHLVNLGRHITEEELQMALQQADVPSGQVSFARSHMGGQIAFIRYATPEVARQARTTINLAQIRPGASDG